MSSPITTLQQLYVEVMRLLDGEEPSQSELPVYTLSRLLSFAQRRIYRSARTRYNEVAFDGVVTDNAFELPDDFEDAVQVHFGQRPLEPVPESVLRERLVCGGSGDARLFAKVGASLMFWPAVADATPVQGRYWARLPDLTDANIADNALFQAADDLFIYATLVECAPYFPREQAPQWMAAYASIMEDLNTNDQRAAYSAGRMRVRPAMTVLR